MKEINGKLIVEVFELGRKKDHYDVSDLEARGYFTALPFKTEVSQPASYLTPLSDTFYEVLDDLSVRKSVYLNDSLSVHLLNTDGTVYSRFVGPDTIRVTVSKEKEKRELVLKVRAITFGTQNYSLCNIFHNNILLTSWFTVADHSIPSAYVYQQNVELLYKHQFNQRGHFTALPYQELSRYLEDVIKRQCHNEQIMVCRRDKFTIVIK